MEFRLQQKRDLSDLQMANGIYTEKILGRKSVLIYNMHEHFLKTVGIICLFFVFQEIQIAFVIVVMVGIYLILKRLGQHFFNQSFQKNTGYLRFVERHQFDILVNEAGIRYTSSTIDALHKWNSIDELIHHGEEEHMNIVLLADMNMHIFENAIFTNAEQKADFVNFCENQIEAFSHG